MRNLNVLGYLMLFVSSLLFFQCTSEQLYLPGEQGPAGQNGLDGVDGTTSCVECHSSSHRDPIHDSYDISKHATGASTVSYTNRTYCAQCHSNEGYIEFQETGAIQASYALPTVISCTTCHDTHDTFDFENDGQDYALRFTGTTQLIVDDNYHIDYGSTSNNCVSCHQPRRSAPVDDGSGMFMITSTHWGPHYGAQSTMLEGMLGAEIAGTTSYPDLNSSAHRTGADCVSCHMGESSGNNGMHSMLPSENSCTTCHTNGAPSGVGGFETDFATLEALLENVVGWEYVYEVDGNGDLVLDGNGDPIIVLDGNGDPVTQDVIGILHDGHPNTGEFGEGATFTFIEAQALWNYRFLYQDHSHGVHNPTYARALLHNSIEALQD